MNASTTVDKFWASSQLDKTSCIVLQSESRCEWCCRLYEGRYAERSLKSHYTKGCDHKPKSRVGARAERTAIRKKRRAVQQQQEKVVLQGM